MECDKMEIVSTPTQVVAGSPDVTDLFKHSSNSSQSSYNQRNSTRFSPSLSKFVNSQSFSTLSTQLVDISHSEFSGVASKVLNNQRTSSSSVFSLDDDSDDTIKDDDLDLDLDDDETSNFSRSLPVTTFIGIRPPPAKSTELSVRNLSSAPFPSSPSAPSLTTWPTSTAAPALGKSEKSPSVAKTDSYGMGVLCPTNDLSTLEKKDSFGFQEPASPSLLSLPQKTNEAPVYVSQTENADSQVFQPSPRSPKRQRFTFEPQDSSNIRSQTQDRFLNCKTDEMGSKSPQISPRSPALKMESKVPQLSPCSPLVTKPQFRRQLSKRKSETILDVPPPLDEYNSDDYDNESEEFHSIGLVSDLCAPASPKARRVENFDPYQVFEVQRTPCLILTVNVVRGRNITMGLQDYYDTPDPYINLYMRTSPEGRKSTTAKENNPNPVWNEEFTFFINFTHINILQITLMESNLLWFDQIVGTLNFDISRIRKMDVVQKETFVFNEVSEVDIEFLLQFDCNPTLRYSLCLSDAEKKFQELRKQKVLQSMRRLLGQDEGPANLSEVPNIAVIGSGGGFRALTGYSGVIKALVESGVFDCTMYAGGLSGSSWLLSSLYSHPKWPNLDMSEFLDELMNSVDKRLLRFFTPSTMLKYARFMVNKRREGQPVSFTDIFGKMVGETLLNGRMETTLTDQRQKLKDGGVPMPLYTCVHVKKDVPAKSFQEWVEFSPYEIGLPKYGTFMDSELFGSKFFMGKLVKQYKEQPLSFLQGIWGSAFCILFKRLLEDNRRIDPAEMIRQEINNKGQNEDSIREELSNELDQPDSESSSDCSDDDDDLDDDDDNESSIDSDGEGIEKNGSIESNDDGPQSMEDQESVSTDMNEDNAAVEIIQDGDSAYEGEEEDGDDEDESYSTSFAFLKNRRSSLEMKKLKQTDTPAVKSIMCTNSDNQRCTASDGLKKSVNWGTLPVREGKTNDERRKAFARASSSMRKSRTGSMSYWKRWMKGIVESKSWEVLSTRRGRAAVIHNFMRGLSLQQSYPLSPFTPIQERVKEGEEFEGIFEMVPTSIKHIYMVDAGLTFNSPYPLILRPQREVDIILSFDFSARPCDKHHPFKELLLAEKWARINRLPFPPIDVSKYKEEEVKELYIFKHPSDPHCPVVFHFALVNNKFKYYSKPGVTRQTKEEFDFAEFDIFDDPKAPYSTFCFTYAHETFKRLSQLTEFNTLLHIDDIKEEMKAAVKRKRQNPNRYNIKTKDIKLLRMKSVLAMKNKLHGFIKRMGSTVGSNTPLYTATTGSPSTNPFFAGYQREASIPTSTDGSVFGTPEEREFDVPDFGASLNQRGGSSSPNDSKIESRDNIDRERRKILSSSDSQYGTPPEYEDDLNTLKKSPKVAPKFSSTHSTNDTQSHSNSSSFTSSSSDSSTPKVVVASQIRTRKESPPNPFFTAFIKSTLSSGSSSSSSSSTASPVFPDSFRNYPKGMKATRRISKKQSPKILNTLASHQLSNNSETKPDQPSTISSPSVNPAALRSCVATNSNSADLSSGSTVSSGNPSLSEKGREKNSDLFSLAPEAFKADGTPITNRNEAKMYYDSVKQKRKLLRRQSTVSSMNNISLDEALEEDEEGLKPLNGVNLHDSPVDNVEMSEDQRTCNSRHERAVHINDLSQFEGLKSGLIDNKKQFHFCDNAMDSAKYHCSTPNQDHAIIDSGTDVKFSSIS